MPKCHAGSASFAIERLIAPNVPKPPKRNGATYGERSLKHELSAKRIQRGAGLGVL